MALQVEPECQKLASEACHGGGGQITNPLLTKPGLHPGPVGSGASGPATFPRLRPRVLELPPDHALTSERFADAQEPPGIDLGLEMGGPRALACDPFPELRNRL